MPILTIAHGTYNNFNRFKKTFFNILNQLDKHPEVEFLILDDSQDESSKKLVNKYKHKQIKYIKGTKISIDHAYIKLMREASGEYVWWFGDDLIFDDSIIKLLKILQKNHPDFIWLNHKNTSKVKNLNKNYKFNASEIIENIGDLLTYLSAIVWKKSYILPHLEYGHEFFGNAIGFCYPQFEALSKEGFFLYVDDPLFQSEIKRDFKNLWYDPFDVFCTHYFHLLENFYHKKNMVKA